VLYRVEPEFSEEARKAKYQGTVILTIEVGEDGTPKNLQIVHSLGLGLDEKAIEAVSRWKFKPASRNGRPVRAPATIEVNFRLL
jgi:TonB family protein